MDYRIAKEQIHHITTCIAMRRSETHFYQEYRQLWHEIDSIVIDSKGEGQNESFDYSTVIECLRESSIGYFFRFSSYDEDVSNKKQATLISELFRWQSDEKYFDDWCLEIVPFIRRKIDKGFYPQIVFRPKDSIYGSCRYFYRTIPHLLSSLERIIPLLISKSKKDIEDEKLLTEQQNKRTEVLESIPEIIRFAMKDEHLDYCISVIDDEVGFVSISFKMPKKTMLSVKLKLDNVQNELGYIVRQILPIVSELESSSRFTIRGYGNKATWKTVNK